MKKIKNSRAIVAYLDFDNYQLAMFKILIHSLELINAENTDLIIFFEPTYSTFFEKFPKEFFIGDNGCSLILISMEPAKIKKSEFENYPFINSLSCLLNQDWLKEYDFILRTDLDIILTPRWNQFYPDIFSAGLGYYNNDFQTKGKLKEVETRLNIYHREDYTYNIGPSWYGKSKDVLEVAALSAEITSSLLTNEFAHFVGEWPGFYRGVALLYASEIATNKLIEHIFINEADIDFRSDSSDSILQHAHIHFSHCDKLFSKHHYFDGKYNDIDPHTLNINVVNQYCLYCALTK